MLEVCERGVICWREGRARPCHPRVHARPGQPQLWSALAAGGRHLFQDDLSVMCNVMELVTFTFPSVTIHFCASFIQ